MDAPLERGHKFDLHARTCTVHGDANAAFFGSPAPRSLDARCSSPSRRSCIRSVPTTKRRTGSVADTQMRVLAIEVRSPPPPPYSAFCTASPAAQGCRLRDLAGSHGPGAAPMHACCCARAAAFAMGTASLRIDTVAAVVGWRLAAADGGH